MKILIGLFMTVSAVSFAQTSNDASLGRITYTPGQDYYEVAFNETDRFQLELPTSDEIAHFLTRPVVAPIWRFFKYFAIFKGGAVASAAVGLPNIARVLGAVGFPVIIYVSLASTIQLIVDVFKLSGRGVGALYDHVISRPSFHRKTKPTQPQGSNQSIVEVY